MCNAADDPEREASYLDLLADRRVDGLDHRCQQPGSPPHGVAVVATDPGRAREHGRPESGLPTIMSDNEQGGRIAADHLLGRGHRLFGYLMPPPRNVDAPDRLAGVRSALADAGCPADALTITDGEALVGGGEAATEELLDLAPGTTAIVAYNDLMAIGAIRALRRRGRRVPVDTSVVGFDDVPLATYVDPALTTISQRTDEMGRWAVERLIGENGVEPSSVRLPVDLRVRDSTGPAPG